MCVCYHLSLKVGPKLVNGSIDQRLCSKWMILIITVLCLYFPPSGWKSNLFVNRKNITHQMNYSHHSCVHLLSTFRKYDELLLLMINDRMTSEYASLWFSSLIFFIFNLSIQVVFESSKSHSILICSCQWFHSVVVGHSSKKYCKSMCCSQMTGFMNQYKSSNDLVHLLCSVMLYESVGDAYQSKIA